jgi:PPK2 family polyphosphate:nucleotide phosphotransferase
MPSSPSISKVSDKTIVPSGGKARDAFRLADRDTRGESIFESKSDAETALEADALEIDVLQDALFASQCGALLVVLQGIDTSGKDGTTKSVFKYTSPLGVRVSPFGRPTDVELAHDYLWRIHQVVPRRGHIGVFNRSHYEDVLVVKVRGFQPAEEIERRYEQINQFEKTLVETGTRVLKIMLHISKQEQGERLRERLEVPAKRWKFNPGDLEDRKLWDDYHQAYETMLKRCSTRWAPWHVVPADSRTRRSAIVARLVRGVLEEMKPAYPDPGYRPEQFPFE